MRYVAITAAVFGGALFMNPTSHSPFADPQHFNSIIKPTAQTVQIIQPKVTKPITAAPADKNTTKVSAQAIVVTVAPGDNLTQLAETSGTNTQRLYDANPAIADPNVIVPGQELRVPAVEESLASRPMPVPILAPVHTATPVEDAVRDTIATPSTAPAVAGGSVWDSLAACESGGNWAINTGNGFFGGLQFTLASWQAVGGSGMPNQASREEQIARGQILQARGGWGNWPACTAKLGIS